MKKLIVIFLLMTATVFAQYQTFHSDTLTATLAWQKLALTKGMKNIVINNASGNNLRICFVNSNTYRRDTLNFYPLASGDIYKFNTITADSMFYSGSGNFYYYLLYGDGGDGVTKLDGFNVTVSESGGYFDIRNSWDWIRLKLAAADTVGTVRDTLFRVLFPGTNDTNATDFFSEWWVLVIDNPDDTIEISTSVSFPSSNTETILPTRAWVSSKMNVSYIDNYYIRTKGTGTSKVYYRVEGY